MNYLILNSKEWIIILNNIKKDITIFNQLNKNFDNLYHEWVAYFGLSNSSFLLLYSLYQKKDGYTQKEICNLWSLSKQTVHSAVQKLSTEGYITTSEIGAEQNSKSKKLYLTKKGLEYASNTIGVIMEVEQAAYDRLGDNRIDEYIHLSQLHLKFLQEEAEKRIFNSIEK